MESLSGGSLHRRVLNGVAQRITSGQLLPGDVIRLEDITDEFQVSRTVARGTAQVLSSMGLVSVRTRVGLTVQPPDAWSPFDPTILVLRAHGPEQAQVLRDIGVLRLAVEPVAAQLSANNASPEQCAQLSAAVATMASKRRSDDVDAYLAADVTFHRTLLEASGNFLFAGLADVVTSYLVARSENGLLPMDPDAASVTRHANLVAAISAADPERSEAIARELVAEALDVRHD